MRKKQLGFWDNIPKKNESTIAWRKIDNEAVVIFLEGESEQLTVFNETAARIWELINGKNSIKHLAEIIASEYDVSFKEAMDEIVEFVKNLSKKKALICKDA